VGWVEHVERLDPEELRELVAPVEEDETELQVLCKAFDWLIQDAQYHAVREIVGQETLFEANRKEANIEPQKPFDNWMDITMVKRYTGVWKQLLYYVSPAEDDKPDKRPPYELTERQRVAMQAVRDVIREFEVWNGQEQEQGQL
jgi:hypothetical protein